MAAIGQLSGPTASQNAELIATRPAEPMVGITAAPMESQPTGPIVTQPVEPIAAQVPGQQMTAQVTGQMAEQASGHISAEPACNGGPPPLSPLSLKSPIDVSRDPASTAVTDHRRPACIETSFDEFSELCTTIRQGGH
jgi:hypothetical protein